MEILLCIVLYQYLLKLYLGLIVLFSEPTGFLPVALQTLILGLQYLYSMVIDQLFRPSQFLKVLSNLEVREFYR